MTMTTMGGSSDVRGGFQPIPEELHPPLLRLPVLFPLLPLESPPEDGHLPVHPPFLRLRRHDHDPAQLRLLSHVGSCGAGGVSF